MENEELEKKLKWYESNYGPYIEKRGPMNFKNLFRKPTMNDWIIMFMIVMMLFGAWAYSHDIAVCRDFIARQIANNITIKGTLLNTTLSGG